MVRSTPMRQLDEDGRQEYALALLEGRTKEEAQALGERGRDNLHSKRSHWRAGRIMLYDWVHEHSTQPVPVTLDDRDPDQIEADFDRRERAVALLDYCTPRQREVLETRLGLLDGETKTYRRTAEVLGVKRPQAVFNREQAGLARIRRELAKPPAGEAERLRLERKRELNRQWMAKKRAESKGIAQ